MVAVKASLEFTGDWAQFERGAARLEKPRELLQAIGVLGMSSSARRCQEAVQANAEGISTGKLYNSLNAGGRGMPAEGTIFDLSAAEVVIGSNLPYAAQRNFGGIIEPKTAKALAIPVVDHLKREGLSPRELDPDRSILRFQPITGAKPNVFAVLIDEGQELTGRQRKKRGSTAYGPGILYVLAYWVYQEGAHFMGWDAEDERVIEEDIWPSLAQAA